MEILSPFRGDKHEFCLAVIKFRHDRRCEWVKLMECDELLYGKMYVCTGTVTEGC